MAIDSRVDAVEEQYPEQGESLFPLAMTAAELALPYTGLLLKFVELIRGHFSTKEREERAAQFLGILRDHEKLLEVLGKNFEKVKVDVADLAEAVQIAAWRDAEAFNDAKRDRYATILGNAVRSEEKIQDLASFIRDVEQLSERDVTVLKVLNKAMNKDGDWTKQSGPVSLWKVHPNTFIQRRQEMAVQIADALGMRTNVDIGLRLNPEVGYSTCARLQGFGLAHEVPLSAREVPMGDYCFRPSHRGLMLLKLLGEEVANWSRYFPRESQ
jgi:hypothetical protein